MTVWIMRIGCLEGTWFSTSDLVDPEIIRNWLLNSIIVYERMGV